MSNAEMRWGWRVVFVWALLARVLFASSRHADRCIHPLRANKVDSNCWLLNNGFDAVLDKSTLLAYDGMIEPRTNPLHLYRALLRECTYLPDPQARSYFHNHVIYTFRQYLPKTYRWRPFIPFEREVRLLDRGRKELSLLRRANEGYLKPLQKVLMVTYGRMGKRRRQLMSNLMHPEPAMSDGEIGEAPTVIPYTIDWKPPGLINKLIRSQAPRQRQFNRNIGGVKVKLDIPEKNIWGRKMSPKRVRNMTKEWYVKNAGYILPPLPDIEWVELRQKAKGLTPWTGPVKRRAKAIASEEAQDELERPEVLLDGPERDLGFKQYADGRPHQITRRLMTRLYAVIFRHTPRLLWSAEKEEFVIRWEKVERAGRPATIPSEDEATLLFGP